MNHIQSGVESIVQTSKTQQPSTRFTMFRLGYSLYKATCLCTISCIFLLPYGNISYDMISYKIIYQPIE